MKAPKFNTWEEARNWVVNLQPGTVFKHQGKVYLVLDEEDATTLACVDNGKVLHFSHVLSPE